MTPGRRALCATFASLKGGMGCSTAIASAAVDLVLRHGRRVLVIDWDLETPSMQDQFRVDGDCRGLLDYLLASRAEFEASQAGGTGDQGRPVTRVEDYVVDLTHRLEDVPDGAGLTLMTAGSIDFDFHLRVESFDWGRFYEAEGGFWIVERLRLEIGEAFDVVLVDARSGHLGQSVIPLLHMPDVVVLLFGLNEPGIRGAAWLAQAIGSHKARAGWGRSPVDFLLAPARLRPEAEGCIDPERLLRDDPFLENLKNSHRQGRGAFFPLRDDPLASFGRIPTATSAGRETPFGHDVMRLVDTLVDYRTGAIDTATAMAPSGRRGTLT